MSDSTLRELLASGRGSCSAGEDGSVLQRLVDLVRKLPFDLHDCQLDALEAALTGSDFVVRMGTGWGKTLTYLLYVLALRAPAVLITPLVALREDQLRELNEWGRRLGFEYDVAIARPVDAELDSDAEASEDEDEEEEVAALEPVPGKSDPLPTSGRFDPEHGWVCDVCDGCKRREGVLPGGRGLKKVCSAKKQLERAAAAVAAAAAAATAAEAAADAVTAVAATPVTDKQGKHRARIAGSPQRMEEEEGSPTASYRLVSGDALARARRGSLCRALIGAASEGRPLLLLVCAEGYVSPSYSGRLLRLGLATHGCRLLIADEAHTLLGMSMGSFRPAMAEVGGATDEVDDRLASHERVRIQRGALTASLPVSCELELEKTLGLMPSSSSGAVLKVRGSTDRPNIAFIAAPLPVRSWTEPTVSIIVRGYLLALDTLALLPGFSGATRSQILYVSYTKHTWKVAEELLLLGINAISYYSEMPIEKKRAAYTAWRGNADSVIVATESLGMGINNQQTLLVVNGCMQGDPLALAQVHSLCLKLRYIIVAG